MPSVLGVDAAWTERQPSGVALVECVRDRWKVVCVAPSYEAFMACGEGMSVDWRRRYTGSRPDVRRLLRAARAMTTEPLAVVALDMPVARRPFATRRPADSAISKAFGGQGCSTHSPNDERPGPLGRQFAEELEAEGFPLATVGQEQTNGPCTIEVYPHTALLSLLNCGYRVPYKISRCRKYWPTVSPRERIANLLAELHKVGEGLERVFGGIPLALPAAAEVRSLSVLKKYEDLLDALICAWVGTRFLEGSAEPYGDDSAAIWVPV